VPRLKCGAGVIKKMNTEASNQRSSAVPLIATGLVAYWLAVVVALHFLEPEFDPIRVPISVYVLGTYGVWMTTSFFVAAAIYFLLAFGLARELPSNVWTKAGIVLLCVGACGQVVAGFYPTQWPLTPPLTQQTVIHLIGALVGFNAITIGGISLSVSFRRTVRWSRVSTAVLIVSLLRLAMLNDRWLWPMGQGTDGLKERVIIVLMLVGFALVVGPWIRWGQPQRPPSGARTSAGAA